MLLAQELITHSNHVVLFSPINFAERVKVTSGIKYCPVLVDFDSKTNINNWLSGDKPTWQKRISSLESFDLVVSDNLLEVLEIRNDAWLSGSFFWHEIIHNYPLKLKDYYKDLLLKYKPKMISSAYFSQSYLSTYTQLYEVGIYGSSSFISSNKKKTDILISCGMGGKVLEQTKQFIDYLKTFKETPYRKVWVEPSLYPINAPKWMAKATYSIDMFNGLIASIIRPGVGTISDSLLSGVKIFAFFEPDNLEMQQNLSFLEEFDLGVNSKSIQKAWAESLVYLKNNQEQHLFLESLKKIEVNGEKLASKILLSH